MVYFHGALVPLACCPLAWDSTAGCMQAVKHCKTAELSLFSLRYNLTSDHDPEWVQRQLNILAPKLRSQLAVNVQPSEILAFSDKPFALYS